MVALAGAPPAAALAQQPENDAAVAQSHGNDAQLPGNTAALAQLPGNAAVVALAQQHGNATLSPSAIPLCRPWRRRVAPVVLAMTDWVLSSSP